MRIISTILLVCAFAGPAAAASFTFDNQAPLMVEQDTRAPRERILLVFPGGPGSLSAQQQGAANILTNILAEGPQRLSTQDYKRELFLLNGEISYFMLPRATMVVVTASPDKLQDTVNLALEAIRTPKFDADNYTKAREQTEMAVAQREDNMGSTLRYFAMRDAFDFHPDVLSGSTSRVALKKVKLDNVKAAWPVLFNPEYLLVGATGPLDPAEARTALGTVLQKNGMLAKPFKAYAYKSPTSSIKAPEPGRITIVNKPGAVDHQILVLVRRPLPRDNLDMVAFQLANANLGDAMMGSLGRTLREERGLTYYAGSREDIDLGLWQIASFASTDKVAPLLKGLDEVIKKQAVTPVEGPRTELLKKQKIRSWKEGRELPLDELQSAMIATLYGRNLAFDEHMDQEIVKVTPEAVTRSSQQNFILNDARWYLMGDKQKLVPIVKKLGYKTSNIRIVEPASIL